MNLREYATFINERNQGIGWGFDTRPEFANPQYLGNGTNWQKELFRAAPINSHAFTLSGGNDKTQYLLSASYFNQEGIALGSEFTRTSIRMNLDNQTTDWLKIGTSLQLTHIDENVNSTSSSIIATALSQTPDIPVRNPDGSFGGAANTNGWVRQIPNPYALALINKDNPKRNQLFGNIYADIAFTKDLSFRNEVSGSFSFKTEDVFNPTYKFGLTEKLENQASYSYSQDYYTTFRSFFTYAKVFNTKYNVNVLAGHEAQLPPSKISALSSGEFVGMVADDPDNKIELKAFHCEILNDHEALKKEHENYKDIEVIRKIDNSMVQRNYLQIKEDIEDIIRFEMEHLLNDPGKAHLVIKKGK